MATAQFKCYVCRSVVDNIPFCGECEIALPNSCAVHYIENKPKRSVRHSVKPKDEDDDLFNNFENVKAAKIIQITHRGIFAKKRRETKKAKFKIRRRARIYERDNFRCVKCGATHDLTLDHILPRSKGGTDALSNLQTLCRKCNEEKEVDIIDYRLSLQTIL